MPRFPSPRASTIFMTALLGGALAACAPAPDSPEAGDPAALSEGRDVATRMAGTLSGSASEVAPAIDSDCKSEYQGGETSCKDEATWISYATQACEKQGMSIGYYAFSTECGKGYWRYIKYECCPKTTCSTDVMGGETSCKDAATWKGYAYDACASKGQTLTNYWLSTECGEGLYRYVKYECCGGEATPPPTPEPTPTPKPDPTPAPCTGDVMGSDSSCKSTATWKRYASMACEKQGLALDDYATYEKCGFDRYRYVKYSCCGQ